LEELKGKAKLWTAQTRIANGTEVKILLTKVDAVCNQVAQLEKGAEESLKRVAALKASKLDLQAQMGLMVPVSELHAARAEAGRLREANDGLNQQLRAAQAEAEKLGSTIQACYCLVIIHYIIVIHGRVLRCVVWYWRRGCAAPFGSLSALIAGIS
jgi:hypothetical protein